MTPCQFHAPLAALLLLGAAMNVQGADEVRPHIFGLVRSTDAGKGALVVSVQPDDDLPFDHEVTVPRDVPVQLMKKPQAKLGDLRPGMRIAIVLTPDERFVRTIHEWRSLGNAPAKEPAAEGVVRRVDAVERRVTLNVRDQTGAFPITFGVSGSATVTLAGNRVVPLDQLKPGTRVVVTLRDNDNKALAISQVADGK